MRAYLSEVPSELLNIWLRIAALGSRCKSRTNKSCGSEVKPFSPTNPNCLPISNFVRCVCAASSRRTRTAGG